MYFDVELGFFGNLMMAIFIIAIIVVSVKESRPKHSDSAPNEEEANRRAEENAKLEEHIDHILSEHEAEVKRILGG